MRGEEEVLVICHMKYYKHQGMYACIAKNKKGTTKKEMKLTILGMYEHLPIISR